jgi:hypothetical protein
LSLYITIINIIVMAQHDYNIDGNQSFPAFETDLNSALVALASTSSGNADPLVTFPNMLAVNTATTPPLIKIRNNANTAWVTLGKADPSLGLLPSDIGAAPLASPGLTGTPTAPTPTSTDNTTKIATTAFVNSYIAGNPTTTTQATADSSTRIASTAFVKNVLSSSPTLGGVPLATTPAATDNTTKIATTAFVRSATDARTRLILTRTTDLTISVYTTWINPDYSSILINSGEYVGGSTRVFTVGTTGYYEINHSACVLATGGTPPTVLRLGVGWSVNGSDRLIGFSQTDRTFIAQTGNQKLLLTAGDTVSPKLYLETFGGSGFTTAITTVSPPSFSITRVA